MKEGEQSRQFKLVSDNDKLSENQATSVLTFHNDGQALLRLKRGPI